MAHPYDEFIGEVEKPGRYLGGEYGCVVKDHGAARVSIVMAYPDVYEIGMSHLGLRILYEELNRDERIVAERAYAPWPDMEARLRERGLPLVSLETAKPIGEFDIVGFSLQYELTYTNVLGILDLAGIPLRGEDRDGRFPLVIAGGPLAYHPEPMAPFIDAFLVGDGEGRLAELLLRYREWRDQGLPRREILANLASLGGVYCPALYETGLDPETGFTVVERPVDPRAPARVERRIIEDLGAHPFPSRIPVPLTGIVFDRFSIEIARGCTEGCRFCQGGMVYRPVRERPPDRVAECVLEAIRTRGFAECSLTSFSTADYSAIGPLVLGLLERLEPGVSLSLSSLRAYGLPDELLEAITRVRNTGLTFAPEAGTQRMRNVVNKNVTDDDIVESAHAVFSRGWRRMKLYFMIGLPTETDDDVRGICDTGKRLLDIARLYLPRRVAEITVSVSSFVPKPHTPFQWARMDSLPEIERKQALLCRVAADYRLGLKWHDARTSYLEAIFARGDRRAGDLLEAAFRKGCRFDGWGEQLRFDLWEDAIREAGIPVEIYLGEIPTGARLPWDHVDCGVKQEFLEREWRRALDGISTPPCGKVPRSSGPPADTGAAAQRRPVCLDCGAGCDFEAITRRWEHARRLEREPAPSPRVRESPARARGRNLSPRHEVQDLGRERYRLAYTKLGRHRYVGHLDLARSLPRILRRARLPMAYTHGFHPKPVLVFAPALRLGTGSVGELLDVALASGVDLDEAEALDRLNAVSPDGIVFTACRRLGESDPRLSRVVNAGEYLVVPGRGFTGDIGGLRDAMERFLARPEVPVHRPKTGRTVDLRPGVISLEAIPQIREPRIVSDLGWAANGMSLHMVLRIGVPGEPKPEEVFAAICDERPGAVYRLSLLLERDGGLVSPLDLEAIRTRAPGRSAGAG